MRIKNKVSELNLITILLGSFLLLSVISYSQQSSFSQNSSQTSATPPISVKTENNALQILINWDPTAAPGSEIPFSIEFKHPFSEMNLQHVNYNIEVFDNNGSSIYSKENLHTHIGSDVQTIMIPNKGSYDMLITVLGTGIDPPFDMTRSGVAKISMDF